MKLILAIALIAVLTYQPLSAQVTVSLASDVWPPFTNEENEQAVALSLVKEALSRSFITAEFDIVPFEQVMDGIADGTYDGSAALWKTEEREKDLLFSQPYMQNQLILVGKKGSGVEAENLNDLTGRVAIVETYAYGDILEKVVKAEFIPGTSNQENLDKLLKGEVDFMLVDRLLIQYLIINNPDDVDKYLAIGTNVLLVKPLHFALRRDFPEAQQIIQRFNQEIVKMSADGTYNRILNLNWITADVDGDGKMEYVLQGNAGVNEPKNSYSVWFQQEQANQASSGYYVEGRLYKNWNEVPEKYKQPVLQTGEGNFNFLKLKID